MANGTQTQQPPPAKERTYPEGTYDYFGLRMQGLSDAQINRGAAKNQANIVFPEFDKAKELYADKDTDPKLFAEVYDKAKQNFALYEKGTFELDEIDRQLLGPISVEDKLRGQKERYHPTKNKQWDLDEQYNADPRWNPETGKRMMTDDVFMKNLGWVANEKGDGILDGSKVYPHYGMWNNDGIMEGKALRRVMPTDENYNPELTPHKNAPYLQIVDANKAWKNSELFSAGGAKTMKSDGWLQSAWDNMVNMTIKNLPSAFGTGIEILDEIARHDWHLDLDGLMGNAPGSIKGFANMLQNRTAFSYAPGNFEEEHGFGENLSSTAYAVSGGLASLLQQFGVSRSLRMARVPVKVSGHIGSATFSSVAADGVYQMGKENEIPIEDLAQIWAMTAFTTHAVERGIRFNDNWITDGGALMAMKGDMRHTIREEIKKGMKVYGKEAWKDLSKAQKGEITKNIAARAGQFTYNKAKDFYKFMKSGSRTGNVAAGFAEEGFEELFENIIHNGIQIGHDYSAALANPEKMKGKGLFGEIDTSRGLIGNMLAYNPETENRRLLEGSWESFIVGGIAGGFMGAFRSTNPNQARVMQEYIVHGKGEQFQSAMMDMYIRGEYGPQNVGANGQALTDEQIKENDAWMAENYGLNWKEHAKKIADKTLDLGIEQKSLDPSGKPHLTLNDVNYLAMKSEFTALDKVWKDSGISQWYDAWQKLPKFKKRVGMFGKTLWSKDSKEKWLQSKEYAGFLQMLGAGERGYMVKAMNALKQIRELEEMKQEEGANIEEIDAQIAELSKMPNDVKSGKAFEDLFKRAFIKQRMAMDPSVYQTVNGTPLQNDDGDWALNIVSNGRPEAVVDEINNKAKEYIKWNKEAEQAWEQRKIEKEQEIQEYQTKIQGADIKGIDLKEVASIMAATSEYGSSDETLNQIASGIQQSIDQEIVNLRKDYEANPDEILDRQGNPVEATIMDDTMINPQFYDALRGIVANEDSTEQQKQYASNTLSRIDKANTLQSASSELNLKKGKQQEVVNPYANKSPEQLRREAYLSMWNSEILQQEGASPLDVTAQTIESAIEFFEERGVSDPSVVQNIQGLIRQLQLIRSTLKADISVYSEISDDISKVDDTIRLTEAEWNQLDTKIQELKDRLNNLLAKFETRGAKEFNYKDQYVRMHKRFLDDLIKYGKELELDWGDADIESYTNNFVSGFDSFVEQRKKLGESPTSQQLQELQPLLEEIMQGMHGAAANLSKKLNSNPEKAQKLFDKLYGAYDENGKYQKGIYSFSDRSGNWIYENYQSNTTGIVTKTETGEEKVLSPAFIDANNVAIQSNQNNDDDRFGQINMKRFGMFRQAFHNFFNTISRTDYSDIQTAYNEYLKIIGEANAPSFEQKTVIQQVSAFLDNQKQFVKRHEQSDDISKPFNSWTFVQGGAGTGKTSTVLRGIIETTHRLSNDKYKGKKVVIVSPHKNQTKNIDKDIKDQVSEGISIDSMDNAAFFALDKSAIESVGYIVVDEASFLDADKINKLKELAGDIPVVLMGDISQMTTGTEVPLVTTKVAEMTNPINEVFRTGVYHIANIQSAFRAVANTYGISVDPQLPRTEVSRDRTSGVEYVPGTDENINSQLTAFVKDLQDENFKNDTVMIVADEATRNQVIGKIAQIDSTIPAEHMVKTMDIGPHTAQGLEFKRVYVNIQKTDYGKNFAAGHYNKAMLTASSRAKEFLSLVIDDKADLNPVTEVVDVIAGASPEALEAVAQQNDAYKALETELQQALVDYLAEKGLGGAKVKDTGKPVDDDNQADNKDTDVDADVVYNQLKELKDNENTTRPFDRRGDEDGGYQLEIDGVVYTPRRTSNIVSLGQPKEKPGRRTITSKGKTYGTIVHQLLDELISGDRDMSNIRQRMVEINNDPKIVPTKDRYPNWKDGADTGTLGDAAIAFIEQVLDYVETRETQGSRFLTEVPLVDATFMSGGTIDLIEVDSKGRVTTHDFKTGKPGSFRQGKNKFDSWNKQYSSEIFSYPKGKDGLMVKPAGREDLPDIVNSKKNTIAIQQLIYTRMLQNMGLDVQPPWLMWMEINAQKGTTSTNKGYFFNRRSISAAYNKNGKSVSTYTDEDMANLEQWVDALLEANIQNSTMPPVNNQPPAQPGPTPPTDNQTPPTGTASDNSSYVDISKIDDTDVYDDQSRNDDQGAIDQRKTSLNLSKGLLTATTKSTDAANQSGEGVNIDKNKQRKVNLMLMQSLVYPKVENGVSPPTGIMKLTYHTRKDLNKKGKGLVSFENVLSIEWDTSHPMVALTLKNSGIDVSDITDSRGMILSGTLFGDVKGDPNSSSFAMDDDVYNRNLELRQHGYNNAKNGVYEFGSIEISNITAGRPVFGSSQPQTVESFQNKMERQGAFVGDIHVLFEPPGQKGKRESGYYIPVSYNKDAVKDATTKNPKVQWVKIKTVKADAGVEGMAMANRIDDDSKLGSTNFNSLDYWKDVLDYWNANPYTFVDMDANNKQGALIKELAQITFKGVKVLAWKPDPNPSGNRPTPRHRLYLDSAMFSQNATPAEWKALMKKIYNTVDKLVKNGTVSPLGEKLPTELVKKGNITNAGVYVNPEAFAKRFGANTNPKTMVTTDAVNFYDPQITFKNPNISQANNKNTNNNNKNDSGNNTFNNVNLKFNDSAINPETYRITVEQAEAEIVAILGQEYYNTFVKMTGGITLQNGRQAFGTTMGAFMSLENKGGIEATTPRHEALHIIMDYLLTPKQRRDILNAAKQEMGRKNRLKISTITDLEAEEYLASQYGTRYSKKKGPIARFFDWLSKIADKIWSNKDSISDFFDAIENGEYANKMNEFNSISNTEADSIAKTNAKPIQGEANDNHPTSLIRLFHSPNVIFQLQRDLIGSMILSNSIYSRLPLDPNLPFSGGVANAVDTTAKQLFDIAKQASESDPTLITTTPGEAILRLQDGEGEFYKNWAVVQLMKPDEKGNFPVFNQFMRNILPNNKITNNRLRTIQKYAENDGNEDVALWEYIQENGGDSSIQHENETKNPYDSFTDMMNMILNTVDYYEYTVDPNNPSNRVATPSRKHINLDDLKQDLTEIAAKAFSPNAATDNQSDLERFKDAVLIQAEKSPNGSYAQNALFSFYDAILNEGPNPVKKQIGGATYQTYSLWESAFNAEGIIQAFPNAAAQNGVNFDERMHQKARASEDALLGLVSMFKSIKHVDFTKTQYHSWKKQWTEVPVRTSYADDIKKSLNRVMHAKLFEVNGTSVALTPAAKGLFMNKLSVKLKEPGKDGKINTVAQWVFKDQISALVAEDRVYMKDGKVVEFEKNQYKGTWVQEGVGDQVVLKRRGKKIFIREKGGIKFHPDVMNDPNPMSIIRQVMSDLGLRHSDIKNETLSAYWNNSSLENLDARSGQASLDNLTREDLADGFGSIIYNLINEQGHIESVTKVVTNEEGGEIEDVNFNSPVAAAWKFVEQIASVEQFSRGDSSNRIFYGVDGQQIYRNLTGSRVDDIYGYDSDNNPAQNGAVRELKIQLIEEIVKQLPPSERQMQKEFLLETPYQKVIDLARDLQIKGYKLNFINQNGEFNNPLLDTRSGYRVRGITRLHGNEGFNFGKSYGKLTESDLAHQLIDALFVDPLLKNNNQNNYKVPGPVPGDKKSPTLFKVEHLNNDRLVIVKNGRPELNKEFIVEQTENIFNRLNNRQAISVEKFHDVVVPIITPYIDATRGGIQNKEVAIENPIDFYFKVEQALSALDQDTRNEIIKQVKASGLTNNKDYKIVDGTIQPGGDIYFVYNENQPNTYTQARLARLMQAGTIDEKFDVIKEMHRGSQSVFMRYLKTIGYSPGKQIKDSYEQGFARGYKPEGSDTLKLNDWLEAYYYAFHIFNSHSTEILTAPSSAFKDMVDQFKRAQSDKSPGLVPTISREGMMPHYQTMVIEDHPHFHNLVAMMTKSNPSDAEAANGATIQSPLWTMAAYDGLGGASGTMSDPYQVTKHVTKQNNMVTDESEYIKTAGFTLGPDLMNKSREARAMVARMLSHKTFVDNDGNTTTLWDKYNQFEEEGHLDPWVPLREYYKKQDNAAFVAQNGMTIHDTHIAQLVYGSAMKQGLKKVNDLANYLETGQGETIRIDSKNTRFQLNPYKDVNKDDAAMLKQLLSQVLIGADSGAQKDRASRIAQIQAQITQVGLGNILDTIQKEGLDSYLRTITQHSVDNMGTTQALIAVLMDDPAISDQVPVIASRTKNVLVKKLNEVIKPRMHGYSAVQAPGTLIELFERNGTVYTLKSVEKMLGRRLEMGEVPDGFTQRKLNHTKIFIKNTNLTGTNNEGWLDIDVFAEEMMKQGLTKEEVKENIQQILSTNPEMRVEPAEIVAPFKDYHLFGLNDNPESPNYYRKWDVNDILEVTLDLNNDPETAQHLMQMGEQVTDGIWIGSYEKLGNTAKERADVLVAAANMGTLDTTNTGMARILGQLQLDQGDAATPLTIDALPAALEKYLLSLDMITNRIPSSSTASGGWYRIVSYTHEGGNYIFTSTTKNIIDNSDFDVDELRVMNRNLGENQNEIEILSNALLDEVMGYYQDPANAPFYLSPVSTQEPGGVSVGSNKIQDIIDNNEAQGIANKTGENIKMQANNITSNLLSYGSNMEGKYTVGTFVLAMKGYTHLYNAYKNIPTDQFNLRFGSKILGTGGGMGTDGFVSSYHSFTKNNKGEISMSEDGEYIINLLGELSQLALDNAKLLTLSKIMANPDTAYMIAGLDIAGVPRKKMVDFLTNPVVVNILTNRKLSTSFTEKSENLLDLVVKSENDIMAYMNAVLDDTLPAGLQKADAFGALLDKIGVLTSKEDRADRFVGANGEISRGNIHDFTKEQADELNRKSSRTRVNPAQNAALKNVLSEDVETTVDMIQPAFDALLHKMFQLQDEQLQEIRTLADELEVVLSESGNAREELFKGLNYVQAGGLLYKLRLAEVKPDISSEIEAVFDGESIINKDAVLEGLTDAQQIVSDLYEALLFGEAIKRSALTANMDQGISNSDFRAEQVYRNIQLWANQPILPTKPVVPSSQLPQQNYYINEESFSYSNAPSKDALGNETESPRDVWLDREARIRSFVDIGLLISQNPHLAKYAQVFSTFDQMVDSHYAVKKAVKIAEKMILPDLNKTELWSEKDYNVLQGNLGSYLISKFIDQTYAGRNMSLGRTQEGSQIGEVDLSKPEGRHKFVKDFPGFVQYLKNQAGYIDNTFMQKLTIEPSTTGEYVHIPGLNKLKPAQLAILQSELAKLENVSTGENANGEAMNNFVELLYLYNFIKSGFQSGPNKMLSLMPGKVFYEYSSWIDNFNKNLGSKDGMANLRNEMENQFKEQFLIAYKDMIPFTSFATDTTTKDGLFTKEIDDTDASSISYMTGVVFANVDENSPIEDFPKYIKVNTRLKPMLKSSPRIYKLNSDPDSEGRYRYEYITSKWDKSSLGFTEDGVLDKDSEVRNTITIRNSDMDKLRAHGTVLVINQTSVSYPYGTNKMWAKGWNQIVEVTQTQRGPRGAGKAIRITLPKTHLSSRLGTNSIQSKLLGNKQLDYLLKRIKKAFPNITVHKVDDATFFNEFGTSEGAGVKDGVVYLNTSKVSLDQPIHEYGHIWVAILKHSNPDLYDRLSLLARDSELYDIIKNHENYSYKSEDEIIQEVLATSIGFATENTARGKFLSQINPNEKPGFLARVGLWTKEIMTEVGNIIRKLFGMQASDPFSGVDLENASLYEITSAMADHISKGNRVSNMTSLEAASIMYTGGMLSSDLGTAEDLANVLSGASRAEQAVTDKITLKQRMVKSMQIAFNKNGVYSYETNGGKVYTTHSLTDKKKLDELVDKILSDRKGYQTDLKGKVLDFLNNDDPGALPEHLQSRSDRIRQKFNMRTEDTAVLYSDLQKSSDPQVRALYNPTIANKEGFDPVVVHGKDSKGNLVVSVHDVTATSVNKVYGDNITDLTGGQSVLSSEVSKLTNTEGGRRKVLMLLTLSGMVSRNPNISYRKINIHQLTGNTLRTEGMVISDYIPELKKLVKDPNIQNRLDGELAGLLKQKDIFNLDKYEQSWMDSLVDFYQDEKNAMYELAKNTEDETVQSTAARYAGLEADLKNIRSAETFNSKDALRVIKSRMDQLMKQYGSDKTGKQRLYDDEEFQLLSASLRNIKNRGRLGIGNTVDLRNLTKWVKGNFNLANPIAQWFIREMKTSFDVVGNRYKKEYKKEFSKLVTPVIKYYEKTNPMSIASERIADRSYRTFDSMFIKELAKDSDGKDKYVNTFKLYWSGDPRTKQALANGTITQDHVNLADFIVKNMKDQVIKTRMTVEHGTLKERKTNAEAWYANNWVDGAIPLIQKRPTERIFGAQSGKDVVEGFKAMGMQFSKSDELYDYITGNGDNNGYGMNDLFGWQAGAGDLGSERRMKMMGLTYDGDGNMIVREGGLDSNSNIETNLETVMNYFNMNQILKQEMDDIMPEYMAAQTILYNYEGSKGEKFKNYMSYLDTTVSYIIKNKREGLGYAIPVGSGKQVKVDDIIHSANGLVSFGIMGGNIYADTVNFVSNALATSSLAYGQQINKIFGVDTEFFDYGDLMKAAKVATTNPELTWKLVDQYRFAQMDHKDMLHRKGLQKTKKRFALFQSNWLFGLNFAGDYANRAIVLMAQMEHDGVLDAYYVEKETGELKYNEKLDPRPRKIKDRIKQELVNEGVQDEDQPLQRAYDSRLKTRVKSIADKYITGSYDAETDRLMNSHILGKTFSMFKKYAFDKIENTFGRGHMNDALGKYEVIEVEDPFTPGKTKQEVIWRERFVEGTIISIFAMLGEAKRVAQLPRSEQYNIWTNQEPARKENIIRLTHDLALIAAIIQVLPFIVGGEDDDDNDKWNRLLDSRLWRSVEYSAMDLIWGANPNEYFRALGDPFVTITQLTRYAQLVESFFSFEASKMDRAARKTFGLYRSASDIYELSSGQK
tara:strand:+ start:10177 stop:30930 length:20754 start_codon:yes stop_codon:yes gene_type:complete